VISVGNLAVGGTGKTPVVAWIASKLREADLAPAILVGGHARDEVLLLQRRLPGIPVVSNRDRVEGALQARRAGSDRAILDDGFQHRRLARDLDVVLLAAEDGFPGALLPRGPYREGPGALSRADVVLVTRRCAGPDESRRLAAVLAEYHPEGALGGVELATVGWTDLEGSPAEAPEGDVVAACAVARPDAFLRSVARTATGRVELVAFADHHEYTPANVARLKARAAGRPIVVTEKDAVKLRVLADTASDFRVLGEEVRWDWGEVPFVRRLHEVAGTGSRA
jgi:tetraacyldisaccharide 4'-kinase